MKNKTFGVLYIEYGQWKLYNNVSNFSSVNEAKNEINKVRKEGTHPLCLNHKVVIYQFKGKMIVKNGIRY